jgi:hypothetical protein
MSVYIQSELLVASMSLGERIVVHTVDDMRSRDYWIDTGDIRHTVGHRVV